MKEVSAGWSYLLNFLLEWWWDYFFVIIHWDDYCDYIYLGFFLWSVSIVYIWYESILKFLFWGDTWWSSELKSLFCIQGSFLVIWGSGYQTSVDCMQGKCPVNCSISLVPISIIFKKGRLKTPYIRALIFFCWALHTDNKIWMKFQRTPVVALISLAIP